MAAILEARTVERRFPVRRRLFGPPVEVRAVDGVSLAVERGETLAIVGESGCGKSTLARLLVGLLTPSAGQVIFNGQEMAQASAAERRALRRHLQFVFQDPSSSLNPRMTVAALVAEPMRVHGLEHADRHAAVARLLRRVGLRPEHADRYPHEFSGGQRQRIGIARALATRPTVLIGDEPVSALDVSIQAQVINLLEDLKTEFGLTLVVIAHDLSVIRHMADRVAVMYLGRVVETAPVEALFSAPRHPYTEALLAAIPIPAVEARRARVTMAGETPNPITPPDGCRFHPRCPYAVAECHRHTPPLAVTADGRSVACHRATELTLSGLTDTGAVRTPAAERRFALFRAAAAIGPAGPNRGVPT